MLPSTHTHGAVALACVCRACSSRQQVWYWHGALAGEDSSEGAGHGLGGAQLTKKNCISGIPIVMRPTTKFTAISSLPSLLTLLMVSDSPLCNVWVAVAARYALFRPQEYLSMQFRLSLYSAVGKYAHLTHASLAAGSIQKLGLQADELFSQPSCCGSRTATVGCDESGITGSTLLSIIQHRQVEFIVLGSPLMKVLGCLL